MVNKSRYFFIACILFFGAGCAHLMVAGESALRKNAEDAWAYKVKKKWGSVYKYCTSDYKAKVTREEFIRRGKLDVKSFKIENIEIIPPGKEARVSVKFDAVEMGILMKGLSLKETWIKEKGRWCMKLPKSSGSPFEKPE